MEGNAAQGQTDGERKYGKVPGIHYPTLEDVPKRIFFAKNIQIIISKTAPQNNQAPSPFWQGDLFSIHKWN